MTSRAILLLKARSSLPLHLTSPFASSIHRLFSTTDKAPPSNPHFAAVDYLTQSLRLPSDVAVRESKKIQHLKCSNKPDAVIQFLRQAGLRESSIRRAVSREGRILCSSVEKNWRPNVTKLRELGLSEEDISGIVACCPRMFLFNFEAKVDYLLRVLGSVANVCVVLKKGPAFLLNNLEKIIIPNFNFLKEQLGLSVPQIVRLIVASPRFGGTGTEFLKITVKRAEELGVTCSSPMFPYAFIVAGCFNQSAINARVNNLKSLGFSQEEVTTIVSKLPLVLTQSKEMIGRKIEFMMKEVACDKLQLIKNPTLFTLSLEKRLIPRSTIKKLLMSKGVPAGNLSLASFMMRSEENFLEKFVLPYEHTIPGLHQAYKDACAGIIR